MKLRLSRRYVIETDNRERILTELIRSGVPFSTPRREENGISFTSSFFKKKYFEHFFQGYDVKITSKPEGLLSSLFFLKERKGLVVGGILGIFLIYLSTFYVWSVKIEGNEALDSAEIIRIMAECGFYEGVKKSDVDVNEVQNEVLKRCHEMSFFSINVHGMVADVVVHERATSKKPDDRDEPYNLVADIDGVIVSAVILDGQPMFKMGDTVARGELLVSGVMDSTAEGLRLRRADGKVFAKTSRTLNFSLPLEGYYKRYVREEKGLKYRILGKSIGKSVGDDNGNFDLEVKDEGLRVFGVIFPVTLERHTARYYTNEKSIISEEEGKEILLRDYKKYISTELDSGEILEENFTYSREGDTLFLEVEVKAIENIAVRKKIVIN